MLDGVRREVGCDRFNLWFRNTKAVGTDEEELVVPQEAVIDTGTRLIVFVADGEGKFRPREVTLGPRAGGYYPVVIGLSKGERVVSSPNFLIDSESRFEAAKEALAADAGADNAAEGR